LIAQRDVVGYAIVLNNLGMIHGHVRGPLLELADGIARANITSATRQSASSMAGPGSSTNRACVARHSAS
jgi:hypothetical protein